MPEPSGAVVFMGAGASKPFGLPLTAQILERIVGRLSGTETPQLFPGAGQTTLLGDLHRALSTLYPGLGSNLQRGMLPGITDVLSLLDHLILYDYPAAPRYGKRDLLHARRLLERAMLEVLIGSDLTSIAESAEIMQPDPTSNAEHQKMRELAGTVVPLMDVGQRAALDQFTTWLLELKKEFGTLSIVSTNYDVTVESELFLQKSLEPKKFDFGFDWRDPFSEELIPRPEKPTFSFYKLHGSFNWLRCDLCGQLYINPYELIAYLSFREAQQWANTCTCGAYPLRHVIVAPSMVRDVRDPHLLNIWRCATEALRTAKQWFIIGYSLPAEDLAIRSMLLRAYNARGLDPQSAPDLPNQSIRPAPQVTVVQKGTNAKPAYEAMFPPSSFKFMEGGLEELMSGYAAGLRPA